MKSCFLLFFRTYPNCPLRNYPVKYAEFSWDWSKGAHPDYGFIIHICPTQRFLLFCARLEARLATWDSAFRYFTAAGQYFVDGGRILVALYATRCLDPDSHELCSGLVTMAELSVVAPGCHLCAVSVWLFLLHLSLKPYKIYLYFLNLLLFFQIFFAYFPKVLDLLQGN